MSEWRSFFPSLIKNCVGLEWRERERPARLSLMCKKGLDRWLFKRSSPTFRWTQRRTLLLSWFFRGENRSKTISLNLRSWPNESHVLNDRHCPYNSIIAKTNVLTEKWRAVYLHVQHPLSIWALEKLLGLITLAVVKQKQDENDLLIGRAPWGWAKYNSWLWKRLVAIWHIPFSFERDHRQPWSHASTFLHSLFFSVSTNAVCFVLK